MKSRRYASRSRSFKSKSSRLLVCFIAFLFAFLPFLDNLPYVIAESNLTLQNNNYRVEIGDHGEIFSLKLPNDSYDTEYFMNSDNSKFLNPSELDLWAGQVMFAYRFGESESWQEAWTSLSEDIRIIEQNDNVITVTYDGESSNKKGIRGFKVVEKFELLEDYVHWTIEITNTSDRRIEIGDLGLPLPFYEQWVTAQGLTRTYEERVLTKSFIGNNSSFLSIGRPNGSGDSLMLIPDSATGAGFEYQDRWKYQDHQNGPENLWANNDSRWIKGLNVYYIHSNHIKKTNKGYLGNTSLFLEPEESKTYGFKFVRVSGEQDLKDKLYHHGLIDVTVIPSMTVPTDAEAQFALRTSKEITSVTSEFPDETTLEFITEKAGDYHIYKASFNKLGPNDITVNYGNGEKVVLQFYVIEPIADALQRHSTFMVEKTQHDAPGEVYDKVFDDWMMHTQSKKGTFNGYWGWGDDWGYTKGQFLAEKNVQTPVKEEIIAVDQYLDVAIWNTLMKEHQEDYLIHDFLMPEPNTTPEYRGYAYPHIYNTYFSMYKVSSLYPDLVDYIEEPETYLLRAYNIFKTMYEGPVAYNWNTGVMGELTTPEIIQALEDEGFYNEASDIKGKMARKFEYLSDQKYPYGSEYNYDNTGEEAVYMLAKMFGDTSIMEQINQKTRFARGWMPAWYYYSIPVTITGENWWNGQYTASLAGYTMDDWTRNHSEQPEIAQRLNWAGKIANVSHINSGQIDRNPENIGAVSWSYQSELGNHNALGHGGGPLLNGWRSMSGEADLGLWGAIKLLSVDISNDPLFGLVAYGGTVTEESGNYVVVPKDGVSQRLNLITEKFNMELQRDKFSEATISPNKDYLKFTLRNVTQGSKHNTEVSLSGLKSGSYDVIVDGEVADRINTFTSKTTFTVPVGKKETYEVELVEEVPYANEAPNVKIEKVSEVTLPDSFQLVGKITDDGLPNNSLEPTWKLLRGPADATVEFSNNNELVTNVVVNKPGEYVFKLTVSDGEYSESPAVLVKVNPAPPVPEMVTHYEFNENEGETVSDSSDNGMNAVAKGAFEWQRGLFGNSIKLNGGYDHVKLPEGVVKGVDDITIATWIKASDTMQTQSIFDFGNDPDNNMLLSLRAGGNSLRFTINSEGDGQRIDASTPVPTEQWKHIAITLTGDSGILYVDGKEVGRNEEMTFDPSDLGNTLSNYIGRSKYGEAYKGELDNFVVYSRALNEEEVRDISTLPLDDLVSIDEVDVTTSIEEAPKLPDTVTGKYDDGYEIKLPVTWDAVSPDQYADEGSFIVEGTIEGTELKAKADVTVILDVKPFPDLVSRYIFDNVDGTTIPDSSGKNHHGTIVGNLVQEENGYKGGSLTFSGNGNYVDMGQSEKLIPSNITVSYWIKRTEEFSSENMLMWFKPEGNWAGNGFFITYNGDSSIVVVDGTSSFFVREHPNQFLPLNEWTNVVVTFNSETDEAAIYKNGVKQDLGYGGKPDSVTTNSHVKKIGVSGYGNGAQIHASLDDFRIYNGAMTEKQVKALHEGKDIVSVSPVEVTTNAGTAPELPMKVSVIYENETEGTAFVEWDEIDPSQYEQPGEFTVTGRVDGTTLEATAKVIVEE
ncbi:DUF5695 domain-containing protein [Pseudalkalibacillus salsuginis]|uniref:DUF5695 domain-containing protein n=1 Tax=Pseudalkalibacillus salsuginis TaxID=2910972 RepID=UPI001F259E1F|nr:DUF5695 domain-containing protein [Pseudalkalibacillus salsuginis]MCF6411138.1 DUF5695 domain-containing protein [Pseudalkalibacillus salsuginis]